MALLRLPVICTGSCDEATRSINLYKVVLARLAVNVVIKDHLIESVPYYVRFVKILKRKSRRWPEMVSEIRLSAK